MSDSIKIDDLMKEFSEAFDEQLRSMPGEEFHIELEENAKPFCLTAPRAIP